MKILFHAVNLLETALSHQKKKKKKLVGNGVVNGFARSSKKNGFAITFHGRKSER